MREFIQNRSAQLLILVLLTLGVGASVYLVQNQQIFNSRAQTLKFHEDKISDDANIEFLDQDGKPLAEVDSFGGFQAYVATSRQIKIKITPPKKWDNPPYQQVMHMGELIKNKPWWENTDPMKKLNYKSFYRKSGRDLQNFLPHFIAPIFAQESCGASWNGLRTTCSDNAALSGCTYLYAWSRPQSTVCPETKAYCYACPENQLRTFSQAQTNTADPNITGASWSQNGDSLLITGTNFGDQMGSVYYSRGGNEQIKSESVLSWNSSSVRIGPEIPLGYTESRRNMISGGNYLKLCRADGKCSQSASWFIIQQDRPKISSSPTPTPPPRNNDRVSDTGSQPKPEHPTEFTIKMMLLGGAKPMPVLVSYPLPPFSAYPPRDSRLFVDGVLYWGEGCNPNENPLLNCIDFTPAELAAKGGITDWYLPTEADVKKEIKKGEFRSGEYPGWDGVSVCFLSNLDDIECLSSRIILPAE